MERVLITGGAGYIGSELVSLLAATHKITVYDNFMCGAEALIGIDGIDIIRGDIRDTDAVARAVRDHDIIVHLAAIVGYPACDLIPYFAFGINVGGTKNVVQALHPDQLLIFCSTSSSYGKQDGYVDETTKLNPLTSYGRDKALAEEIVKRHSNHIIFRPATAYGVSRKLRLDLLTNNLFYLALTKGVIDLYEPEAIRPLIHVKDFAAALKYAVEDNIPIGEIYNLVGGNFTKREIAEEICSRTGASFGLIRGSDPDQRSYKLNFDKLISTGFKCKYCIEDAYYQLKSLLPIFADNYERYTVSYQVKRFLGRCQ